jgi:hypothetical protein
MPGAFQNRMHILQFAYFYFNYVAHVENISRNIKLRVPCTLSIYAMFVYIPENTCISPTLCCLLMHQDCLCHGVYHAPCHFSDSVVRQFMTTFSVTIRRWLGTEKARRRGGATAVSSGLPPPASWSEIRLFGVFQSSMTHMQISG